MSVLAGQGANGWSRGANDRGPENVQIGMVGVFGSQEICLKASKSGQMVVYRDDKPEKGDWLGNCFHSQAVLRKYAPE